LVYYAAHYAAGFVNTSGHTGYYKDNMFGAIEVEKAEYQLKPMNCPGHILIFKSRFGGVIANFRCALGIWEQE